jgi:hypothetical protein
MKMEKEENELGISSILSFSEIIGFQETPEFEFHFFPPFVKIYF